MNRTSRFALSLLAAVLAIPTARAATITWTAGSLTDTNWSTASNWGGTAPTAADDVKFYDTGTNGTVGLTSSFVDGGFGGTIGSLQFGNTNGVHTITIAPNSSLNIASGNFIVGTPTDLGVVRNLTNSINGLTSSLNYSNAAGILSIQQGTATGVNGSRGNLDLSGLGNFNANISRIGLGTTATPNPGNAIQREAGLLSLARTNLITLTYSDTLANYQLAGRTNAIELSRNPGNNGSIMSLLILGQTNAFFVDSMGFGRDKASASSAAWMGFNPAFLANNPSAYFRGIGGTASRIKWWAIGDMNANASSAQVAVGTNDFTGGTVDALVDVLSLARDCSPSHTATATIFGTLTFNAGTIDANTVYLGNQSLGPTTSTAPNVGIINVNGSAVLRVNTSLVLGRTTVSSTASAATRGILNIRNGSVFANTITCGANSTNNVITITNGTLVVTNTAGTSTKAITLVSATNSTLGFVLNGANNPNLYVTNLVTGGATNFISIPSAAVFTTYPTQVTLVKYVGSIAGAGFNFGLSSVAASAPGAYLSNNTVNASIDLVLPTDPRPLITSNPLSYAGDPGDNVNFSANYSGTEPITTLWLLNGTTVLTNGPTGSGATIAGATTATLSFTSAQIADSGTLQFVASNPYGSVTSAPASLIISTGDVTPIITGPNNQTVVQGNNATLSAAVAGKPVPALQWYKDGVELSGQTTTALTILNAQYPADQATYSLIASNAAGMATNSAVLTVIVAPVIAVPPANIVATNTQAVSFSVVSTNGVPAVTYQWKKNGGNVANATNATLSFASVAPADMGSYTVLIANSAGSVLSSPVTLTVNSIMAATTLSPSNTATSVFYDTPLSITFSAAPTLRSAGTIKIYNAANPATPVDTIDLSLGNAQQRLFPGDNQSFTYNVVSISGNTATIFPHFNVMSPNQTYFVTVDNGVFTDAAGAYFVGITDTNAWQFTTKATGPADANNMVVAADGSGDFVTVQGAINSIPANSTTPRIINIRNGDYNEIVNISGRHNVTFRGQSRTGVVVGGFNNANFQTVNSGTTHARMAFKVNANDIGIDNLTLTNRTPQGGSQAEALMIESGARRFICNNATLVSRQDTILANVNTSQGYFNNSTVIGNFDYIWGGGNLFFTNSTIHTIAGAAGFNITAARTDFGNSAATGNWVTPDGLRWSSNGFSFISCQMTAEAGVTGITLAGNNGTVGGVSSWINCRFSTAYVAPGAGLANTYNFWQSGNTDSGGVTPVSFANVQTITGSDPRFLAAQSSVNWLNGWQPEAPFLITQPANALIPTGGTNTFVTVPNSFYTVTYQWQHYGTNITDATNSTLTISGATGADAGDYTVIVNNGSLSTTSRVAVLSVGITAPVLPPISDFTVNVGVTVTFTNNATDSDLPAQLLTYSLLSAPSGATLGATNGVFSFRPNVNQAASSNYVAIRVSDNATPSLSATQSFSVFVNPLGATSFGNSSYSAGVFNGSVAGDFGPDYQVQASTNLVNWEVIYTTNSPAMPFNWSDPNAGLYPQRFYQIKVGPPLP